jgi:uncharacterized protein (TIGR03083 family)
MAKTPSENASSLLFETAMLPGMGSILFQIDEHVAALDREGALFAAAVDRAGPDTPVPTCPEWVVRDLARHLGGVHRWATGYVAGRAVYRDVGLDEVVGTWPDDGDLVAWFRDGHRALVDTLAGADPDLDCWTFLPAPSPLAMWARRQAHETAVHRVDAELAAEAGGPLSPFDPRFAADGVDELLTCFVSGRSRRLRSEQPRSMRVRAVDAPGDWLVTVGPDGPVATRLGPEEAGADCDVSGPAGDLYLALWNRRPPDVLTVTGDAGVLELLLDRTRIRWR